MKRFYKNVAAVAGPDGFAIELDGRPIKTPARKALLLPTRALADAVVVEWTNQGETIDPRSMPLTGLANAAIDRITPDPAKFIADIAVYGESDVTCYRADEPAELVAQQAAKWDSLLDWARGRYDVHFEITTGIIHQPQPAATVARLGEAVAACDTFTLAGLQPLTTIGGSLVAALAVIEGAIAPAEAFAVTHLDELWQAQQWGEDSLALAAREARESDFIAAARFVALAHDGAGI